MKYEIDKPHTELTEGYFTLIIKYIALFIVGWIAGWIFLLVWSEYRTRHTHWLAKLFLNNPGIVSVGVALTVVWFFAQRAYMKYKLGLLTAIEFDDTSSTIKLELLNTINGNCTQKIINKTNFRTSAYVKEDLLFGKKRIFEIYDGAILINKLNIDMTAWCRQTDIEKIIEELNRFDDKYQR